MKLDRIQLEASVCRDSFYEFIKRFWSTVITEDYVDNWHIEYLCEELQVCAMRVKNKEPNPYDLIINIPPGTSKSTICSVMFPAWLWTFMPTARCICASYSHTPLALELSVKCRDVVRSEKYILLYGDIGLREDQNTKGYFANKHGGSRLAVGTGGSVTGFHGHFLIVDDPLDPNRAVSEAELRHANRWMTDTLPTRKVDKEITVTMLIMQRLHQNDPTGHLMAKMMKGSFRHIKIPGDILRGQDVRPRSLRRRYVRGLLDPKRLTQKSLDKAMSLLGEYNFAGQFDQNPVPMSGGMFRVTEFGLHHSPPPRLRRIVRYWDKAGTRGGGAYTVGVKMGVDVDGGFWVLDVVRGQWEASTREKVIRQTAEMDGRGVIVYIEQEPGSGGKESAQGTIRKLAGFIVRADRPKGRKEDRADPYAVQVNGGNVNLVRGAWNIAYVEELRYFGYSEGQTLHRYKDQVDASSGAFAMLTIHKRKFGAFGAKNY